MIPTTIHQIWMTGEVPARLAALGASWREQHPGWEYRLWTEASLSAFVRESYPEMWDLYRRYPELIQRVDAARYMLLHHFGGVYADFDVECLRPLDPLRAHDVVLAPTTPFGMSNDLMMSVPRHDLFAALIAGLSPAFATWGHWYVLRHFRVLLTTGSLHLTRTVWRASARDGVHVLPPDLYSSQARTRAYVYHWPGNSWARWDTRLITRIYYGWRRVRRSFAVVRRET